MSTVLALKFKRNCYNSMTDDQVEKLAEIFGKSELSSEQLEAVIMAVSVEDGLRGTEAITKVQARIRSVRTAAKVYIAKETAQDVEEYEATDAELLAGYEECARIYASNGRPRLARLCRRRIDKINAGKSGQFSETERAMFTPAIDRRSGSR